MSLFLAIRRANQAFDRRMAAMLPKGLTSRQALILDHLLEHETLDRQRVIVERLGIDRSTLTDMLRRLQKAELIDRVRNKGDARSYVVTLTPQGREVAAQCRVILQRIEDETSAEVAKSAPLDLVRVALDAMRVDPEPVRIAA